MSDIEIKLAESRLTDQTDSCSEELRQKRMTVRTVVDADVTELVRRILGERSIRREVTEHADLREVGLSSLDMVNLVLSVESAFDLQIPEAQITPANFRSIAAIDALLSRLRAGY